MAQLNFDATNVEPDTGFDTIPAGWYNARMDESDIKPTKDGLGQYLQVRFAVIDGQYANRKLFARLNIKNANPTAQEIALKQLSAIGHAVGVLQIAQSEQLHNLPLKLKVKIRKGDDNYEDQNEIIAYKNINEPVDTVGGASGAAAPAAAGGAPAGFAAAAAAPAAAPVAAPVAPAAPAAPVAPAAVAHNPIAAAEADGWVLHPQNKEYHWKGADVVKTTALAQRYPAPAPAAAPAAPAAQAAPAAPAAPAADGGAPWATGAAAAAAADPANPFGGEAPAQPWAGGAAPEAAAAAPAAVDPAAAGAVAAQAAPPPWAAPAAS